MYQSVDYNIVRAVSTALCSRPMSFRCFPLQRAVTRDERAGRNRKAPAPSRRGLVTCQVEVKEFRLLQSRSQYHLPSPPPPYAIRKDDKMTPLAAEQQNCAYALSATCATSHPVAQQHRRQTLMSSAMLPPTQISRVRRRSTGCLRGLLNFSVLAG